LPSADRFRFDASCSAAETIFGFLLRRSSLSCPLEAGHPADAGDHLVFGFDKSIIQSCQLPASSGQ
jgi:hypothetical protein